ncbi:MAG: hypothetical protein DMG70_00635 [Acidobacteria bacterium]|nr:MAG: hypothetical protein DMG70_00635 [Acidobacteriota bacterium]
MRQKNRKITFRRRDYAHSHQTRTMTLEVDEFLRRFPLHVRPPVSCAFATSACSPTATVPDC